MAPSAAYVALLRGINVGGKNKLPSRNWRTVLKLIELAGG